MVYKFLARVVNDAKLMAITITLLCLGGFIVNVMIFYPGFLSSDSIAQLMQAEGRDNFSSLQPPVMVIFWKILITVTGKWSAMLLAQLGMLWLAIGLLSYYLYLKKTKVWFAMLVILVPFLPTILCISGVIWKDNQMAFAMLLGSVLVLYTDIITSKRWRIVITVLAVFLFVYGTLTRFNALPAIFPLVYMAFRMYGVPTIKSILSTLATVIVTVLLFISMPHMLGAYQIDIRSGIYYDDLLAVYTKDELYKRTTNADIRRIFSESKGCIASKDYVVVGAMIACEDGDDKRLLMLKHNDELARVWKIAVLDHPDKYLKFKLKVYLRVFLFPYPQNGYVWQEGIDGNPYGYGMTIRPIAQLTEGYVKQFFYKRMEFLFEPWLWLIISIVMIMKIKRDKKITHRFKIFSLSLAASSILYILSYLPSGATNDYRYIYWPVVSMTVLIMIYMANLYFYDKRYRRKIV